MQLWDQFFFWWCSTRYGGLDLAKHWSYFRRLESEIGQAFSAWNEHDAPRLAAALAFYALLSLAPLTIFAVAAVSTVFGHASAQTQILSQVQRFIGTDGANAVRDMLNQSKGSGSGVMASLFGLATLLFGASGVFSELRSALNTVWDVQPEANTGVVAYLKDKFFSIGMVLGIGFLLLVSLLMSSAIDAAVAFAGKMAALPTVSLRFVNIGFSLIVITVLFALIFKFVPEARVDWKDVWVGAMTTASLFVVGKFLIGLYLTKAAVSSTYGAAGSLVVVILWVYYSSLIFFFGAEFTYVQNSRRQLSEGRFRAATQSH